MKIRNSELTFPHTTFRIFLFRFRPSRKRCVRCLSSRATDRRNLLQNQRERTTKWTVPPFCLRMFLKRGKIYSLRKLSKLLLILFRRTVKEGKPRNMYECDEILLKTKSKVADQRKRQVAEKVDTSQKWTLWKRERWFWNGPSLQARRRCKQFLPGSTMFLTPSDRALVYVSW